LPKTLLIDHYFIEEKRKLEELQSQADGIASELGALVEEHSGEDGYLSALDKINKANVCKRLKEITLTKTKSSLDLSIAAESEAEYGGSAVLLLYLDFTEST